MRKFLWIFIPIVLFVSVLAIIWNYSERSLSLFLINKVKYLVHEKTEWSLEVKKLQIHLAPPRIEIDQLEVTPPSKQTWMTPLKIESIDASIDLLNLLAGQIKFSIIKFSGLNLNLTVNEIPSTNDPIKSLPIAAVFDSLQIIPIKMVYIEKAEVQLKISNESNPLKLQSELLIQSSPQSLFYNLKTTAQLIKADPNESSTNSNNNNETTPFKADLLSKGTLTPKDLVIQIFKLNTQNSSVGIDGEFSQFSKVIQKPHFGGMIDIKLDAQEINSWIQTLAPVSLLPTWLQKVNILGTMSAQGKLILENWNDPTFELKTKIQNFNLQNFLVGSLETNLNFKNQTLESKVIEYEHEVGHAQLENLRWNIEHDDIESKVDLKDFDLQKLFKTLHLEKIPVDLNVKGNAFCQGSIIKKFKLECKAKLDGENLDVRTAFKAPPPSIIELKSFTGTGTVSIDTEEVRYESAIELAHSSGQSQGVINYNTGFTIDFKSDDFSFQDASHIAGLEFEGKAKLQGRTQGDSNAATLEIALNVDNFWFESYGLGSIQGKLNYEKGHLLIDSPNGKLQNSNYLAQIDVDLNKSHLKGLVESPQFDAQDAVLSLSRRVPVPFTISGMGRTRAQFEGPFQLGQLTYQFDGFLSKGDIQGENFDEIKWAWYSQNGHVSIENNTLQKGNALITVNGTSTPEGNLNLKVDGNNFKLEHSTFLSKYVKTLGGDINFNMSVNNHILKPDINLEGSITHTTLGDSELPDSKFNFKTDATGLFVNLDLLSKQLFMNLKLPYKKTESAELKVNIFKFNFADFLALTSGSPLRNDYNSLLSMQLNLLSENNNLFESSGELKVQDLFLARNELFLKNEKPMYMSFNKGIASFKDFSLKGPKSSIVALGENFSPKKLKVNFKGFTDLKLYQLFTPFFDDVSGPVSGEIRVDGSLQSPEIYGNIDLKDITLKIKGFSALFDHISSHLEFSQKRISIEQIRGSLAGGSIAGDGTVVINGLKDVRVDLKAQLRNIRLEVPEHVQSSGSGDVVLSGNWFPYTLSGTYRVNQGFVDKDFEDGGNSNSVRQSIYLPKNVTKSSFDPLILDLQIYLDKKVEIKNPKIAGFITGQLQVKGPPENPILLGSIKTQPQAQLFFRDKIFDIQSGLVKFNDPTELNPELFFTARSIVEKYEVNLLLQGKAKTPQLNLSSQPPLEEQEIISLLALGVTTQTIDSQMQSSKQATQMGNQLGAAIISANPLNKEIKQSLGVDVKFSSNYDDTKSETINKFTASKELIPRKLNATASISENQKNFRFQYLLNDRVSSVLTYEETEGQNNNPGAAVGTGSNSSFNSIFGLDLEYKVEFK